jgi:threonine dehydrogenase-like Zn-dependent dehydrogenase
MESATGDYIVFNPVDRNNQDKILGHSYDGVFAEAVYMNSDCMVHADPLLPIDLAPLVEPLATAIYAWKLISMRGDLLDVGIWGGGSAAILTALVAALNGARAHIFHTRPERLLWLSRRELPPSIEFYNNKAVSFTSSFRTHLDAGIICVPRDGAMLALGQALDLVREDGCIDLFGGFALGDSSALLPGTDLGLIRRRNVCGEIHPSGMLSVSREARGRVWLTGHRGSSAAQLMAAQQMLLTHARVFGSVISDVVSLEQASSLIPSMLNKSEGCEFLKVIIDLTMTEPRRDLDLMLTPGRF